MFIVANIIIMIIIITIMISEIIKCVSMLKNNPNLRAVLQA